MYRWHFFFAMDEPLKKENIHELLVFFVFEFVPKNPFHIPKTAFRHAKRGFRHGWVGKGRKLTYF